MPSTMKPSQAQDVEFQALDGTVLRGWLYPASQRGAAVIMTHGFNCRREMILPDLAALFHKAGFSVLLYDNRSLGSSDGEPRNDIDPHKQVEDSHDAVTFMRGQPLVDGDRVVLWGYSFAASVALCAAALDRRVAAVVATNHASDSWLRADKLAGVLGLAQRDREARLAGGAPMLVPVVNSSGKALFRAAPVWSPDDPRVVGLFRAYGFTFSTQTTVQSYYRIATWEPAKLMPLLALTPVMVCAGEEDPFCRVKDEGDLRAMFSYPGIAVGDAFQAKKTLHRVPKKGHMDIFLGREAVDLIEAQIEWLGGIFPEKQ